MLYIQFGNRPRYPELERLICVVASDRHLASQLLSDPLAALARLEQGMVHLSPVERSMVTSITDATDIHDFAARLHARVQQA